MDERLGGVHEGQDSLLRKNFLQPSLVLLISLRTIGIQNLTLMSSPSWGSPLDSAEGRVFFACVSDGCRSLGRTSTVRRGQSAVQDSPAGREPLPTEVTGALPRAARESKAGKRCDQSGAGAIGAVLRLERSAHHCAARDAYPLAQEGIPALPSARAWRVLTRAPGGSGTLPRRSHRSPVSTLPCCAPATTTSRREPVSLRQAACCLAQAATSAWVANQTFPFARA